MQRRRILRLGLAHGSGLITLALLGRPRPAAASPRSIGGTLPELDQPAPPFHLSGVLPGADGTETRELDLADFRGQWLVLYFYPKDFTGGCTLEARGFQRDLGAFSARGAVVAGISADDTEAHDSFCASEGLAFPLLSDPGGAVSRRYGSWIAPFSLRHTFLIDPGGVLRARWVAVSPAGHSREVLEELDRLQS